MIRYVVITDKGYLGHRFNSYQSYRHKYRVDVPFKDARIYKRFGDAQYACDRVDGVGVDTVQISLTH